MLTVWLGLSQVHYGSESRGNKASNFARDTGANSEQVARVGLKAELGQQSCQTFTVTVQIGQCPGVVVTRGHGGARITALPPALLCIRAWIHDRASCTIGFTRHKAKLTGPG